MRNYILMLAGLLMPLMLASQGQECLKLPNQEMLSSDRVLFLMQDNEGCLWYATEGGGVCRDDGRQVDVFRSDAGQPDLLGSNNVCCLAEAGRHIIIGTFHGAYVLDRDDFSIRRLAEVDDKRVDDILLLRSGDVLLTANMKVYRYDGSLSLSTTYQSPQKYVARLFEDSHGHIWATQWQGGLLRLEGDTLVQMPWPLDAGPTVLADDTAGCLWVGTVGHGVVRYHPDNGQIDLQSQTGHNICIDMLFSAADHLLWVGTLGGLQAFRTGQALTAVPLDSVLSGISTPTGRMSLDRDGRLLVASREGASFAIGNPHRWTIPAPLTTQQADSIRLSCQLSARPTAFAFAHDEGAPHAGTARHQVLWFSTGGDIRMKVLAAGTGNVEPGTGNEVALAQAEEVVLPDTKDVSAMTFTADGTLWLGTIFGQLYRYKDGQLTTDEYAANEAGDGITALGTDDKGRLVIVYDRYVRLYDTMRHTLRQQSREADDVYCIELQETAPDCRWSQPQRDIIVERMPRWLSSWWMWCVYVLFTVGIIMLLIHYYILRRQRSRFLEMMRRPIPLPLPEAERLQADQATPDMGGNRQETDAAQPISTAPATTQEQDGSTSSQPQSTSPSRILLEKAIAQVEKNLSNDQYTVEELSSDLCMSRMTLYRKIQSLTGQKPSEFIRTIRLRRAAELLRQGRMTVTEVSYATGFSSISYFSRCFRTMYGVPPTQFGKTTTADERPHSDTPS